MTTSRKRHILLLPLALTILSLQASCLPENEDRQQAHEALARWEDQRYAPEDSLLALMHSGDAHVRLRAIRAAGLIGRRDITPALIESLQDRSETVARQAAFSLGLLGDPSAVPALKALIAGPGDKLRLAAIRGLAHLPHRGEALLAAASHPDPEFAAALWDALNKVADPNRPMYADSAAVALAVIQGLNRPEAEVLWRVLRCAERVAGPEVLGHITPHLRATNAQVRVHAYRVLSRVGTPVAVASVLEAYRNEDTRGQRPADRTRIAGLRALGRQGHLAYGPDLPLGEEGADRLTEAFIEAAGSGNHHLATTALDAMAGVAGHFDLPPEAAEQESLLPVWRIRMGRAAQRQLEEGPPARRAAAARSWATLRGLGAQATLLESLQDTRQPRVLAGLVSSLGLMGEDALAPLMDLAAEGHPLTRSAALEALHTWSGNNPGQEDTVLDQFTRAAADHDFVTAATACGLLRHHRSRLALIALLEAWDAPILEGHAEVRRAILATLEGWGESTMELARTDRPSGDRMLDAAGEMLREAFDSPDLRIRLEARNAALASTLLPARLIPSEGSLRATLPPFVRHPRQPALSLPHPAGEVICETDRGRFVIRLDGEIAPNTCAMFKDLIGRGYYEGLTFHRVVPDFVAQGGDPRGDGWGGPGYTIRSEWSSLTYARGMVGIAHDGKDTGGSQFFVTLSAQPHLDGRYTIFGEVSEGMEVVDQLQVGDTMRFILEP